MAMMDLRQSVNNETSTPTTATKQSPNMKKRLKENLVAQKKQTVRGHRENAGAAHDDVDMQNHHANEIDEMTTRQKIRIQV